MTVAIKCGGKNQHFLRTLLGGRGGGLEKCMVCTPVKMLIIVNDPLKSIAREQLIFHCCIYGIMYFSVC